MQSDGGVRSENAHTLETLTAYDLVRFASVLKPSVFSEESHAELARMLPVYESELKKMTTTESAHCAAKFHSHIQADVSQPQAKSLPPIKIMGIGDSQAHSLLERMREVRAALGVCLQQSGALGREWVLQNNALPGESPLLYLTHLDQDASPKRSPNAFVNHYKSFAERKRVLLERIRDGRPNVVFLMDGQPSRDDASIFAPLMSTYSISRKEVIFGKAIVTLLQECVRVGVTTVYLVTGTPFDRESRKSEKNLMRIYRYVLDYLQSHPSELLDLKNDLSIYIFQWHLLICPSYSNVSRCPNQVYGFNKILPDGVHPEGMSGELTFAFAFAELFFIFSLTNSKGDGSEV